MNCRPPSYRVHDPLHRLKTNMTDNLLYSYRFLIPSERNVRLVGDKARIIDSDPDKLYTVAFHKTRGVWTCSCQGWKTGRCCKHLIALGLPSEAPLKNRQPKPVKVPQHVLALWREALQRCRDEEGSPYAVLGIQVGASWDEVFTAYQTKAKQYNSTGKEFEQVRVAYKILEDQHIREFTDPGYL